MTKEERLRNQADLTAKALNAAFAKVKEAIHLLEEFERKARQLDDPSYAAVGATMRWGAEDNMLSAAKRLHSGWNYSFSKEDGGFAE